MQNLHIDEERKQELLQSHSDSSRVHSSSRSSSIRRSRITRSSSSSRRSSNIKSSCSKSSSIRNKKESLLDIPSHYKKQILIGPIYAEKIDSYFLLDVFKTVFRASLRIVLYSKKSSRKQ